MAVAYEPEIRSLSIIVVPVQVLFDGDRVLPSPKVIPQAYDARIKLVKKIITCVTACERNSSCQFAVSEFSAYTITAVSCKIEIIVAICMSNIRCRAEETGIYCVLYRNIYRCFIKIHIAII